MPQYLDENGNLTGQPTYLDDFGNPVGSSQSQQPQPSGNFLTRNWVNPVQIPQNIPEWQKLPGEIYNRFIHPMSSPAGALTTGITSIFGGPVLGTIARYMPRALGAGLGIGAGAGAYNAASDVPEFISNPSARGAVNVAEDAAMIGMAPIAKNLFFRSNKPSLPNWDSGRLLTGKVTPIEEPIPTYEGPRQLYPGRKPLALPAAGETSIGNRPDYYAGIAGVAPAGVQYPHNIGLKQLDVVEDIGPDLAASRMIEGIPFRHPQGPLHPRVQMDELIGPGAPVVGRTREGEVFSRIGEEGLFAPTRLEHPTGGMLPNQNWRTNILKGAGSEYIPNYTPRMRPPQPTSRFSSTYASARPDISMRDMAEAYTRKPDIDIFPSKQATVAAQLGDKSTWINELFNLPRAIKSSLDFSAPFRQGLGLAHRKEFWTSFDDMFKAWGSKAAYDAVDKSIIDSPHFKLGQESGLKLTETTGPLSGREEDFMSKWAEKVPGVARSNRAYSAFLNKTRQDTFDSLINDAKNAGLEPEKNLILTREIAQYINNASGRGSLGKLEQSAVVLNNLLFSPRLISARIQTLNPNTYIQASPFVRKQYLKSLISLGAAGSTMVGLGAAGMGTIEEDPRSTDFGKLKIGNTRLDPYGGNQQYMVLVNRLITGQSKSSTSGKLSDLGSNPVMPTRLGVLGNFAANKLHPTMKFAYDWLNASNNRPFQVPQQIGNLFVPMVASDLMELAQDDPKLLPLIVPATFGMGVQTY